MVQDSAKIQPKTIESVQKNTTSKGDRFSFVVSTESQTSNESKQVIDTISKNIKNISTEYKFDIGLSNNASDYRLKSEYVLDIFKKQGNVAHNSKIGDVELVKSGAKSTIMHGFGNVKLAAVEAIKEVIENGDIISHIQNYNNTGTDRYIIAAKGKIGSEDAYVGVVVKSYPRTNENNKFYLHEAEIIKAGSPLLTAPVGTVGSPANFNLARDTKNVNTKFSIPSSTETEYTEAVANGDMETAQRLVDEAAKKAGYVQDDSWKMDHTAPNSNDGYSNSMDKIDRSYGSDGSIYSNKAVYYYGEGRNYDYKAISVIKSAKDNPEKMITVYRAVPNDITENRVRNGDWVAIVKEYAIEHGDRTLENYRIIENQVPAKHLYSNGDSINEWGYDNGNASEVYKNNPNNVKTLEVTYDDNGNIIPLSERFNPENEDIRYSVSEADEVGGKEKAEKLKTKLDNESKQVKKLRQKQIDLSNDEKYQKALSKLKNKYGLDNFAAAVVLTANPTSTEGIYITLTQMGFTQSQITEMFNTADEWQQESGYGDLQNQIDEIRKSYDITQEEILQSYVDEYGAVKEGAKPNSYNKDATVPKSVDGKEDTSLAVRSILESGIATKKPPNKVAFHIP